MARKNRKKNGNMIRTWANAVTRPTRAFAEEARKKHTLGQGAAHIIISSAVTGILLGATGQLGQFSVLLGTAAGAAAGTAAVVFVVIASIALGLISWVVWSAILYAFARWLRGKGGYAQQSYLIAIYSAPMGIITSAVAVASGAASGAPPVAAPAIIGTLILLVLALYQLFLLTTALRSAHRYSAARAILTWLIPVIIIVAIAVLVAGFLVASLLTAGAIAP